LGNKNDLEEKIAQFIFDFFGISPFDGFDGFVGLFQKIGF
jgi:hypothetical protein